MTSPYGGKRGGGRKKTRKPGGQPGNVNRRASLYLPKAADREGRRAFLDALEKAEGLSSVEKAQKLVDLGFARVMMLAEESGVQRIIRLLLALDNNRRTEARLAGFEACRQREALHNTALVEIVKAVSECERCSQLIDQALTGLELALKQLHPFEGESYDWMEQKDQTTSFR
ncbi:MAG TPA: hypothetical protein VLD57_07520 [Blastocatellia bacterium]|nr:hypothetical protein [Blastocatellia bacterium]